MWYPGSSATLEQDNIAFTDYTTLLFLCHSSVEGMTMTVHHLLARVQIYPLYICGLWIISTPSTYSDYLLPHWPHTLYFGNSTFIVFLFVCLSIAKISFYIPFSLNSMQFEFLQPATYVSHTFDTKLCTVFELCIENPPEKGELDFLLLLPE